MVELSLIFQGKRWPAAVAKEDRNDPVALADGTLAERPFVLLVSPGLTNNGAPWKPEITDAAWHDLATLNLSSHQATQKFARKRGDITGGLGQGRRINPHKLELGQVSTSQWWPLAQALRVASSAWGPPSEEAGISFFLPDRRDEARKFLWHPAAAAAREHVRLAEHNGQLVLQTNELSAFMVVEAWQAIDDGLPMRRCRHCDSWFVIRRLGRNPQFCSDACRARQRETQTADAPLPLRRQA